MKRKADLTLLTDRPWAKNYILPPDYAEMLSSLSLYEAYIKANENHLDELAIFTMDTKFRYTHRDLIKMIDLAAAGLSQMGITYNDRVGILLNNTVEDAVSLLALNKLGAIAVFIDFTKGIADIAHSISMRGVKLLLIDESLLQIEDLIDCDNIPIVVANQTKPLKRGTPFIGLYKKGNGIKIVPVSLNQEKPSVIINSSGTTGQPKPIVHTDYSINRAVYKILCSDYPLTRNNVLLKTIPSFIGLGLITSLYTALISGTTIFLVPGNNPQQAIVNTITCISNFPMYREWVGINQDAKLLVFSAPTYFRVLCENLHLCTDLSYIGAMLAAGAKMGKVELDTMNKKLANLHCPVNICNGYGQNEMCGAVTLNTNSENKNGSAGFPVIGTNIRIVDPETYETIGINQRGLILEQSDSLFLRYDNMPNETKTATVEVPDGSLWFNTKDLGEMDEDGFIYITGRISRVLVRYDCKISIDMIEEKIKTHPAVFDCAVIVLYTDKNGEEAIAFISLDEKNYHYELSTILNDIQNSANPLSDMEYPSRFIQVPSLPYLKNGKVDYRALEQMAQKREGEDQ